MIIPRETVFCNAGGGDDGKFNYDRLPDGLKKIGLFAPWNTAERHGRIQKIPYRLNGQWASTQKIEEDFHDFGTAMKAYSSGDYRGVGVGICNGVCAIDIDHCINGAEISELAKDIVNLMPGSYGEISVSGEGLHLLFLPSPDLSYSLEKYLERNEELGLEVYISGYTGGRFIALTGQTYGGDLIELNPQEILDKYMLRPMAECPPEVASVFDMPDLDDFEVIDRLEKIERAARLLDGDTSGYKSTSEAVAGLIYYCLFWTDKSDQIERIVRGSRIQWKRMNDHRGGTTLLRYSIDRCRKNYTGERYTRKIDVPETKTMAVLASGFTETTTSGEESATETVAGCMSVEVIPAEDTTVKPPVGLICAESVEYQEPSWLWRPYLQIGKLNLIQGESGSGKTALLCAIAAAVTTGSPIMNSPLQESGAVLMLSVEDDQSVLRGRFEADGGDVKKLYFMNNAYNLSFCSPAIEQAIQSVGARLVVFDPLQCFLGAKIDFHRANETRPVLSALAAMAERNSCAVLIVAHTGKSNDKSVVYRSLGSADIPAAMRSILHVMRDPDDLDEVIALHIKSSNDKAGQALTYTIGDRGRVDWRGFRETTIGELESGRCNQSATLRQECKEFILTALQAGEVPSKQLDEQLQAAGFRRDTCNRAKTELKNSRKIRYIHSVTEGGNRWNVALTQELHTKNDQ